MSCLGGRPRFRGGVDSLALCLASRCSCLSWLACCSRMAFSSRCSLSCVGRRLMCLSMACRTFMYSLILARRLSSRSFRMRSASMGETSPAVTRLASSLRVSLLGGLRLGLQALQRLDSTHAAVFPLSPFRLASSRVARYLKSDDGRVCLHVMQVRVCILCLILDNKYQKCPLCPLG